MSITATINSPDLLKQANILKHFPEITAKHYRPALQSAVDLLEAAIRPNIPIRTGRAQKEFGGKVLGKNIENLKGQVGWYDKGDPWYINIVEYGARDHPISKGSNVRSKYDYAQYQLKKNKAAVEGAQGVLFIPGVGVRASVDHPGFSKRGFMAAGYAVTKPIVESELGAAGEKVVAELAAI